MLLMSESIKDKVGFESMSIENPEDPDVNIYADISTTATPSEVMLTFKGGQQLVCPVLEMERIILPHEDYPFENFKIIFSSSSKIANFFISDEKLESVNVLYEESLIMEKKIDFMSTVTRNIKLHASQEALCQLIVKQRS